MKSFTCSYVWWPGLDKDLEERMQKCIVCQRAQKMPERVPVQPWECPEKPWSRLHIDHAGSNLGKTIMIVIEAHSTWIEAHIIPWTSATAVIDKLRSIFATHDLLQTVVSDNSRALTSAEFKEILRSNGVEHVFLPPYHPSSNGQVECTVHTVKYGVKKMETRHWRHAW